MQPGPQQSPQTIEINTQNQYITQNRFGQQDAYTPTGQQVVIGNPPQNGLISASYTCSQSDYWCSE